MPAPTSPFDRAIELAKRLTATAVVEGGQPVVVYRGEHGASTDLIHARTRAVSFGSAAAASDYAQHPDLCAGPARAGVYVQGRGWSEAAAIVFQYGDVLERFPSLAAAEQWLSQPQRAEPDQVWEEGGGQVIREFFVSFLDNRIVLVEQDSQDEREVDDVGMGMTIGC